MRDYILGTIVAVTVVFAALAGFFLPHPACFVVSILALVAGVIAIAIIVRVK